MRHGCGGLVVKSTKVGLILCGMLVFTSGCVPSMKGGSAEKTAAQLGIGGGSSGASANSGGGAVAMGLSKQDAFQQTLYPLLRARTCAACHSTSGNFSPFIADASVATAWQAIDSGAKINLLSPANSPIVLKVRTNHNCGSASDCSATADAFTAAITNMNVLVQPPVTTTNNTTTTTTGGNTATTTIIPGLSSVEAFRQSLHPVLTLATCAGCHGNNGPQAPYAGSNVQNAHDSIVGGGLVDLSDIAKAAGSGIVTKVRSNHNCGSAAACTALADTMVAQIVTWRALMQPTQSTSSVPPSGREYSAQIVMPGSSGMTADTTKIFFEAESGTLTGWTVVANNLAADAKVITVANGAGNATNQADANTSARTAIYKFNVTTAGTYRIWGRVLAPTTNDDTAFFRIDNNAFNIWTNATNANLTWRLANNNGTVTSVVLAAGEHTLEVRHREDGMSIDRFLVTSDNAFTPTGVDGYGSVAGAAKQLEWDVSALAGVTSGVKFQIDVADFDGSTYIFTRPRLVVSAGTVVVKNVMIHINNVYQAGDSTFTVINQDIVAPGGNLNNDGMLPANTALLVLKGANPSLDKFNVSFEMIQVR